MTQETRKSIGQRIRSLREQRNLTQEQLALMTGVGRSYHAALDCFLEKIAISLDTTLGNLFENL